MDCSTHCGLLRLSCTESSQGQQSWTFRHQNGLGLRQSLLVVGYVDGFTMEFLTRGDNGNHNVGSLFRKFGQFFCLVPL